MRVEPAVLSQNFKEAIPRKSINGDCLIRRKQSIDFGDDVVKKEIGANNASDANGKKRKADRCLERHLLINSSQVVGRLEACDDSPSIRWR